MSYEGYEQHICKNGHYFLNSDLYNFYEEICPICKAPSAWWNAVDCTNYNDSGVILEKDLKKHYLLTDEVVETCNLGHAHITSLAVFRVPADRDETEPLRKCCSDYADLTHICDRNYIERMAQLDDTANANSDVAAKQEEAK